jgi:hypothetical protein
MDTGGRLRRPPTPTGLGKRPPRPTRVSHSSHSRDDDERSPLHSELQKGKLSTDENVHRQPGTILASLRSDHRTLSIGTAGRFQRNRQRGLFHILQLIFRGEEPPRE